MCGFPTTCLEIQLLALVGLDVMVSCPRPITASFPPDGSSSKLPRANLVSSQEERQEREVKMPTMGPAVGISEKERDRQIFRELLGSSGGPSVQDDIFQSDDEDEVDDSEFESAAGNSRDSEFE